jgi:hypothetical protein
MKSAIFSAACKAGVENGPGYRSAEALRHPKSKLHRVFPQPARR